MRRLAVFLLFAFGITACTKPSSDPNESRQMPKLAPPPDADAPAELSVTVVVDGQPAPSLDRAKLDATPADFTDGERRASKSRRCSAHRPAAREPGSRSRGTRTSPSSCTTPTPRTTSCRCWCSTAAGSCSPRWSRAPSPSPATTGRDTGSSGGAIRCRGWRASRGLRWRWRRSTRHVDAGGTVLAPRHRAATEDRC